jgi:hypothetical protein
MHRTGSLDGESPHVSVHLEGIERGRSMLHGDRTREVPDPDLDHAPVLVEREPIVEPRTVQDRRVAGYGFDRNAGWNRSREVVAVLRVVRAGEQAQALPGANSRQCLLHRLERSQRVSGVRIAPADCIDVDSSFARVRRIRRSPASTAVAASPEIAGARPPASGCSLPASACPVRGIDAASSSPRCEVPPSAGTGAPFGRAASPAQDATPLGNRTQPNMIPDRRARPSRLSREP